MSLEKIIFNEGDLLYGTNVARTRYVQETGSQAEFRISAFRPWSELAPHESAMPRIIDIYHDVIRDPEFLAQDAASNLSPYVETLQHYRSFLAGETNTTQMCLRGLDFFTHRYKVHFLLTDYTSVNRITTEEIEYIRFHELPVIFHEK